MFFKTVINPTLWAIRLLGGIVVGVLVILGIATFFAGGWFVASMSALLYADFIDFHNSIRVAFKNKPEQSVADFAVRYDAPLDHAIMVPVQDLTPRGMNDKHQWAVASTPQPTIQCPDCGVRYVHPQTPLWECPKCDRLVHLGS